MNVRRNDTSDKQTCNGSKRPRAKSVRKTSYDCMDVDEEESEIIDDVDDLVDGYDNHMFSPKILFNFLIYYAVECVYLGLRLSVIVN